MPQILIIDDDPALLDVLALAFEDVGYSVVTAEDGQAGYEAIEQHAPDVVVSDVNMPRLDGFSLCRRLREAQSDVPFIMLTSRDNEVDEALGFDLGADDYVTKPFSTRVLLARVKALLRRRGAVAPSTSAAPVLVIGPLQLDPERVEVTYHQTPVKVTVSEFRVLETLVRRPGIVFSRGQILSRVRGDDSVVAERIVDTYIRSLRRRLEAVDATFDRIETVVGAGYRYRHER